MLARELQVHDSRPPRVGKGWVRLICTVRALYMSQERRPRGLLPDSLFLRSRTGTDESQIIESYRIIHREETLDGSFPTIASLSTSHQPTGPYQNYHWPEASLPTTDGEVPASWTRASFHSFPRTPLEITHSSPFASCPLDLYSLHRRRCLYISAPPLLISPLRSLRPDALRVYNLSFVQPACSLPVRVSVRAVTCFSQGCAFSPRQSFNRIGVGRVFNEYLRD